MPKHARHKPKPQGISKVKAFKALDPAIKAALKKKQQFARPEEQASTGTEDIPRIETRIVGRAVILCHGAGGSSSHASMKAWRQRLEPSEVEAGNEAGEEA